MEQFSEGLTGKASGNLGQLNRNPLLLNFDEFSRENSSSRQTNSLPSLELTKENFLASAKEAFKYVDQDNDGTLTKKELERATKYPLGDQPKRVSESIKIMYDKFEFLVDLAPINNRRLKGYYPNGIWEADLERAQDVLDGKIGSKPLSWRHRDIGLNTGEAIGWLGTLPGMAIGTSIGASAARAIGAGEALALRAAFTGASVGAFLPVIGAAAIGYGIGYLWDRHEAKKVQAKQVKSFLSEFDR
ncbi:MAG: hypothetical protein QG574_4256 [Cyanobacteriota bacterium erpe_2018_sw_21hr_WHONDRS-SW48-000092_B_bin.40]|jgi:hypothetical protein|nr:hypothetical protein [Cyanobacteriota bacterium erpe_2018_sw_21hr_WHONDRS-SW48-000092_B_bin.40]